jgi:hypothetical protein
MSRYKEWLYERCGTKRYLDSSSKTIFMPDSVDPTDYAQVIRDLVSEGWVVKVEE